MSPATSTMPPDASGIPPGAKKIARQTSSIPAGVSRTTLDGVPTFPDGSAKLGGCQLDAKFPPSLYVKNPPLWLSRLTGAGSLQVPSGTWCCVGWAAGWPKATSPMSVSLLPPRRRGAGGLWETRSVFQGVWEGAGRGAGGGSLPYPGRPPAGVMGAGGRGAFSASNLWKNTPRRQADPGRIHHVSPGRIIPLNPPAPQRRPGRQPRRQCRARYASAGQPCASP